MWSTIEILIYFVSLWVDLNKTLIKFSGFVDNYLDIYASHIIIINWYLYQIYLNFSWKHKLDENVCYYI